ncbi:MAG: polysaccharide deacetylase family protein [Polyangiaceae bacterium]
MSQRRSKALASAAMLAWFAACAAEPNQSAGSSANSSSASVSAPSSVSTALASASSTAPGAVASAVASSAKVIASAPPAPTPVKSAAPRFLPENPGCAVPAGFDGWSWKRVHRVENLDVDAVVITLDVGARLPNLARVLDVLRDEKVATTIFLYTGEIASSPDGPAILKRMVAEGHELANHTLSHKDLTTLDEKDVKHQLDAVEELAQRETGASTHPFFREPFLATNDDVDKIVREDCYRSIWFTVDTGDWKDKVKADDIVANVFEKHGKPRTIERGSIFIFHGSQKENLDALPRVIHGLRDRGFTFLTLGEALRRSGGR